MLKEQGFEVYEAGDGKQALDRLKEVGKIDLALVDWNMPAMNGLEFVRAVRSDPNHKDMRLMMVTTETETFQVAKALEAGANGYVKKPFTRESIVNQLDSMGIN